MNEANESPSECNGICLYGADIGVPEHGGVAYAHPDCPEHGGPGPSERLRRAGQDAVQSFCESMAASARARRRRQEFIAELASKCACCGGSLGGEFDSVCIFCKPMSPTDQWPYFPCDPSFTGHDGPAGPTATRFEILRGNTRPAAVTHVACQWEWLDGEEYCILCEGMW